MSKAFKIKEAAFCLAVCMGVNAANADPIEDRATLATRNWAACLVTTTRGYAQNTKEEARTIVDAAFGSCAYYEEDVKSSILPMHMKKYVGIASSTSQMVQLAQRDTVQTFESLRRGYGDKMLAYVIEIRSAEAAGKP